jgi:hypothetical protein
MVNARVNDLIMLQTGVGPKGHFRSLNRETLIVHMLVHTADTRENSLFPGFQKGQFDRIVYRNFHPKLIPNLSNPGHGFLDKLDYKSFFTNPRATPYTLFPFLAYYAVILRKKWGRR